VVTADSRPLNVILNLRLRTLESFNVQSCPSKKRAIEVDKDGAFVITLAVSWKFQVIVSTAFEIAKVTQWANYLESGGLNLFKV
jgi:hypothetical protein